MSDHYRTPEEIERDIERERSGLSSTLHDLNDRLSFDGLAGQVGDQVSTYATDLGQTVTRIVRENPLGVALTGIGIAWLIFGDRARETVRDYRREEPRLAGRADPASPYGRPQHLAGYSSTGAPRSPAFEPYTQGHAPAGTWADDRHWADTDFEHGATDSDSSPTFLDRIWSAVGSAKETASDLADSVKAGVHDASHSVADASHRARSGVKYRTRLTSDAARRMRERLAEGTEHLSEEARDRVIAARERAVAARREASNIIRARSRDVQEGYNRQPLVGGAVAFAVGAAVGAMLPRTRVEDQYFGERSDALMHQAELIYREERAKVERVASDTLDEAGKVLREKQTEVSGAIRNAAQSTRTEAEDAAKRVADTAKESAKDEKLGQPSQPKH